MTSKVYTLIFIFLFTNIYVYSQNNYYYYKGKKVKLEIDKTKINIITNSDFNLNALNKISLKKTLSSNNYNRNNKALKNITLEFESSINEKSFLKNLEVLNSISEVINYGFELS